MAERKIYFSKFVQNARLNAMFDAVSQGVTHSEELRKKADEAARRETDKIGRQSIYKFENLAHKLPVKGRLKEPTSVEDTEWQVDKWFILEKPVAGRRFLQIQIKSSDTGVDEYKKSTDFKKDPTRLVINSRKSRKDSHIIRDFMKEYERVKSELESRRKT